ncbi:MAG: FGGY family carbohydrate kinase [Clostridium sp.]|nr:FGGY family carbohydrate kinase [Clostridium sp.]
MQAIGIDIGTTTISGVVIDAESRKTLLSKTVENGSFIKTDREWERIQDAELIVEKAGRLLEELLEACEEAGSIGLTGQMHGILYVDKKGKCISPLYTWQDGRGNLAEPGGKSLAEEIYDKSKVTAASGYGLVTHLYNLKKNQTDAEEGAALCTIADYFGMVLTGRRAPLLHVSMADSLGFFDGKKGEFLRDTLVETGVNPAILPDVTKKLEILGRYKGIPVTAAIGDNQAGFLGAVGMEEDTLLVNMGTGGQISVLSDQYFKAPGIEARPYLDGKYLLAGATLCGGRAYAILESFFRSYFLAACGEEKAQYDVMEKLAEQGLADLDKLRVATTFRGTRTNPELRGSITGIDEDNFTPQALICGVLQGMARELYDLYGLICEGTGIQVKRLIASGNGLRKNRVLWEIFSRIFQAELTLSPCEEEAAYGAAVASSFSLRAIRK